MNEPPHNRRSNFWTLGDIARGQEWLGHANIATTRIYDRKTKPEGSPNLQGRILGPERKHPTLIGCTLKEIRMLTLSVRRAAPRHL
jgi:hypothetical protein